MNIFQSIDSIYLFISVSSLNIYSTKLIKREIASVLSQSANNIHHTNISTNVYGRIFSSLYLLYFIQGGDKSARPHP